MKSINDLIDKKFLIIGGTGFIGSRLIRQLILNGINPSNIKVVYYPNSLTSSINDIKVKLFPADILDKKMLSPAFKGVDFVFHFAGNTSMDIKKKHLQWLVNVEGTRNIMELSLENDIKKVIYTSTVNTLGCPYPIGSLGNENTSPYVDERPEIGKKVPKNHIFNSKDETLNFIESVHKNKIKKWWNKIKIGYFDSKLAAQELVNLFYKENNLPVVSILPGTSFGPGDDLIGNGLYLLRIYHNSMPGYIKSGGYPLAHVDDVARGHFLALLKGKLGERYIITGKDEDNRTMKDMLSIITKVIQSKVSDRKIKFPSLGIGKRLGWFIGLISELFNQTEIMSRSTVKAGSFLSFYTAKKAKNELDYVPKKTFEEAVEEMFAYYKSKNYLDYTKRVENLV
ncbi:MAG: NAD-dependent epimerase/dehydratase family protein [Candidatus Helarchaeota archaeon]